VERIRTYQLSQKASAGNDGSDEEMDEYLSDSLDDESDSEYDDIDGDNDFGEFDDVDDGNNFGEYQDNDSENGGLNGGYFVDSRDSESEEEELVDEKSGGKANDGGMGQDVGITQSKRMAKVVSHDKDTEDQPIHKPPPINALPNNIAGAQPILKTSVTNPNLNSASTTNGAAKRRPSILKNSNAASNVNDPMSPRSNISSLNANTNANVNNINAGSGNNGIANGVNSGVSSGVSGGGTGVATGAGSSPAKTRRPSMLKFELSNGAKVGQGENADRDPGTIAEGDEEDATSPKDGVGEGVGGGVSGQKEVDVSVAVLLTTPEKKKSTVIASKEKPRVESENNAAGTLNSNANNGNADNLNSDNAPVSANSNTDGNAPVPAADSPSSPDSPGPPKGGGEEQAEPRRQSVAAKGRWKRVRGISMG
jgi:hypothetical protein